VSPIPTRRRADLLLVERGLFESRAKAQAAIAAGLVTADDTPVAKASAEISIDAVLKASPAHPYVSRGGVKLAAALDAGLVDVAGRFCLDVGASTGGFTEVLLARGARHVYAVDVGRDQLHATLRGRPNITSLEGTDIRTLNPAALPEQADVVVIDASFISLKLIIPAALQFAAPQAMLVALIKPQFELKRSALKKGIVRDPGLHATVCDDIATSLVAQDCEVLATLPSPILGGDGNREFFVIARRRSGV
jgi:23S rRNA (cytidine1920-2'-O)/16S rRNA (cytidine1409-2'-O)-methyltransferase